jgi:hypothetical protein
MKRPLSEMQDNLSSPTTVSCGAIASFGKNSAVPPPSIGSPRFARDEIIPLSKSDRDEAFGQEAEIRRGTAFVAGRRCAARVASPC